MPKIKVITSDSAPFHKSGTVLELDQEMADHFIKKGFAFLEQEAEKAIDAIGDVVETIEKKITQKKSKK